MLQRRRGGLTALTGLVAGAVPAAWRAAGFAVEGDGVALGSVSLRLDPDARGLAGWAWSEAPEGSLDGLPVPAVAEARGGHGNAHPNGIGSLDHIVALTPSLDRTTAALESAGLELRRRQHGQTFFWLGETILEVVEREGPARLWGIAVVSADLDATCAHAGALIDEPRDAVQSGRRIATFRREAGLGVPVAVMSPHVPA